MAASQDNLFYIARDGLEIYDMSDPLKALAVGGYHPNMVYTAGTIVQGDTIYSVDESSLNQGMPFLHALRASDLKILSETPIELSQPFALMHWYWGMALDRDRLYVAGRTGVYIYDIGKPDQSVLLAYHEEINAWLNGVAAATVDGKRLLFTAAQSAAGGFELKAFDVSDATNVTTLDGSLTLDDGYSPTRLYWNAGLLYALYDSNSPESNFYILKLENGAFSVQSSYHIAGLGSAIAVKGGLAAVRRPIAKSRRLTA